MADRQTIRLRLDELEVKVRTLDAMLDKLGELLGAVYDELGLEPPSGREEDHRAERASTRL